MNLCGVVSLLDMLKFYAPGFTGMAALIQYTVSESKKFKTSGVDDPYPEQAMAHAFTAMRSVEELCQKFSLISGLDQTRRIAASLANITKPTVKEVIALLLELQHRIDDDLARKTMLFLDPGMDVYYQNKAPFGEAVYNAFEGARYDLTEMANCIACDNFTAAVFHSMRSAEWGLRALCIHFGFKKVRNFKKAKGGRFDLVPIAYSEWEKMLNKLESKVDDKIKKLQRGFAKQKLQEFYLPILRDIRAIKDTWRNHVMHTRSEYTKEDALAAMAHVRELMISLAARGVHQI